MWILNAIRNGNYVELLLGLGARLLILFVIIPIHETAHGWMAMKLGDPTAKSQGRLTLNPIAHFNPIGGLSLLLFGFGWANPVPVNPFYFKHRKRDMALTALAGPVSNLLFALLGAFVYNLLDVVGFSGAAAAWVFYFLYSFILINISLAVFNLIPIPPLDGSRIFAAILPDRWNAFMARYERYLFLAVVVLLFSGVLDPVLNTLSTAAFNAIFYLAGLPFGLFGLHSLL